MSTVISDHDQRQYAHMRESISAFSNSEFTLQTLHAVISSLEFFLQALEVKDTEWQNKFYREWGVLDEVYAISLDENLSQVRPENIQLIRRSIANIQAIIPVEANVC